MKSRYLFPTFITLLSFWLMPTQVFATQNNSVQQLQAGYYHFQIGSVPVIALSDGTMKLNTSLLNAPEDKVAQLLKHAYAKNPIDTSVNAYLILLGQKRVLIDAGTGPHYGPTLGKLPISLRNAGFKPEDITDICITHMHLDHIGGMTKDKKRVFPNATIHIEKQEFEFWTSQSEKEKAPKALQQRFTKATQVLMPYKEANKVALFDGKKQLFDGLTAIPMRGHTPGHSFYQLQSDQDKLMFWGDIMHVAPVQFSKPDITIKFDINPKAAAPKRIEAFLDAAKTGFKVAPTHLSFPGVGQIRQDGDHYHWYPILYTNDATPQT